MLLASATLDDRVDLKRAATTHQPHLGLEAVRVPHPHPVRHRAFVLQAGHTLSTGQRQQCDPPGSKRRVGEGWLADAVDALVDVGVSPARIQLVGGAAANSAVARIAATLFDAPIEIPTPGEYVADGAARQAAWALSGASTPPTWGLGAAGERFEAAPVRSVREAYAVARDLVTQ